MNLIITRSSESVVKKFNFPVYGITGKYTLSSGIELPYFITTMPIERVISEIKVAEEISASLENKWSLGELYQREVDRERVYREIVQGYLTDPAKLKFFNAITVVLMPKSSGGNILDHFPEDQVDGPIIPVPEQPQDEPWANPDFERIDLSGLQYVKAGDQARLRWDEGTVHAVAVDGQHRVVALREFKQGPRVGHLREDEKQTTLPIIFLLLNENLGLKGDTRPTRAISREIFTDLNKNAKTVDRAREIILDDLSVQSRCLRTLITDETSADEDGKIPLSLVRWQDETNRFDNDYHLNSIVHLDLLLRSLVGTQPPKDPMDKEDVAKFIERVVDIFGDEGALKKNGKDLKKFYEENFLDDTAEKNPTKPFFRLPADFLEAAVKGFEAKYKPWLVKLLTEFEPYARLLKYCRENELVGGVFSKYWAQTNQHRLAIREEETAKDKDWFQNEITNHINAIEQIKGRNNWAFKAIFQKALVCLGRDLEIYYNDDTVGRSDELLEVMGEVYDKGLFSIEKKLSEEDPYGLWAFFATNPGGGSIRVNKKTEDRLYSLLKIIFYSNRLRKRDPSKWTATKLYNFFNVSKNVTEWPGCKDSIDELHKALNVVTFHGGDLEGIEDTTIKKNEKERIIKIIDLCLV